MISDLVIDNMGGKLDRMERKMEKLSQAVLKGGNRVDPHGNILPPSLTQKSQHLRK